MLHPKDCVSHIRGKREQNCPSVCFPDNKICVCVCVAFMIYVYRIYMHLDFGGLSFSFVEGYFQLFLNLLLQLNIGKVNNLLGTFV